MSSLNIPAVGDPTERLIAQLLANRNAMPETARNRLLELVHEREQALEIEKARTDFAAFAKRVYPNIIWGAHLQRMAQAFMSVANGTCKRLIINMPPRHPLALDTPIPTTSGWKTMATVQPGDYVFSPSGAPVLVTGKSPIYSAPLYKVTTSDGAQVRCDGGHLWTVRFHGSKRYQTYTTEQLLMRQQGVHIAKTRDGRFITRGRRGGAEARLPMLPLHQAVQYPDAALPLDPYVLGVWLGDGSRRGAVITSPDHDAEHIRAQIEERGYETSTHTSPVTFGIKGLHVQLRENGLLGNKHIPAAYLTASISQRLDLIRGLMDTDGTVSKRGQCCITQKEEGIILALQELLRSVGVKAKVFHTAARLGGREYGTHYGLTFYMKDAFSLPRKRLRAKDSTNAYKQRSIFVETLEQDGQVQCLQVANEDGLFLAGRGYVVTHNSKSEMSSFLLPAWFLGLFPHKKIMQASHTAELAVGFGRKVRNLIDTEVYNEIFPGTELRADSKAAGRWATSANGEYHALGVLGAAAGKGADIFIIDDAISEQEALSAETNPEIHNRVYEWYTSGPRQRLQPGGAIILVMTRWGKNDLTGKVLSASAQRGGDEWEVIEFPAILPSGNPLWPEFWTLKELDALRTELSNAKWQAQYQQNPVSDSAAIVKREWWRIWPEDTPPKCEYLLMSWDTAFEKHNRADYSACTLWGVFYRPDDAGVNQANIILLNAFRDRMEFPELKKRAIEQFKTWKPDTTIVEKKASGAPLIYEMRAMGIPVQEYTPSRGSDKIARLNSVADLFASGMVWAPNMRWAEEVIDEVAEFPAGEHDDYVDSTTLALMRFRAGGFIRAQLDEDDYDDQSYRTRRLMVARPYY